MSTTIIRSLLEQHLNALSPAMPTAFENLVFPSTNAAYQRLTLIPARSENPTMGDGFYRDGGIFQIMLSYPLKEGAQNASARAQALRQHFKRGTTLMSGTLRLMIMETPYESSGYQADGWFRLPVSVPYVVDVYQ